MTTFGLTPQGFVPKRLADILDEYTALFLATFGADVDMSANMPHGQLRGILSDREATLWELLDFIYQSGFTNGATGVSLDQLFVLASIKRLAAQPTKVTVHVLGTNGTVIPSGRLMSHVDTGALYTSTADATITLGSADIPFEAVDTGAQSCLTGKLSVIATPVAGWASGINVADGIIGRAVETDAALRSRRNAALITVVSSSNPGVVSGVLRVTDVTEVREIENATSAPDVDGRPAHSYELVVRGGDADAIRASMFLTKPSGIQTIGNLSGTVVDLHGDGQTINFSRPTEVPIFIEMNMIVDASFPTDGIQQVVNTVLAYGQTILKVGQRVSPFQIEQTIETAGIIVPNMTIGLNAGPVDAVPLVTGSTQLAVFDSSHLIVRVAQRI